MAKPEHIGAIEHLDASNAEAVVVKWGRARLHQQFTEADRLKATIKRNLELLGYGE